MSKQNYGNSGSAARKTGGAPTKPVSNVNAAANRPGAATRPTGAANRPRAIQTTYKKKKGFRLKPLDIGLIVAGVLIVGIIIFSAFQAPTTQINPGATVSTDAKHVAAGQVAPAFTVQDVDGGMHSLSDYKGKVVVAEFMATWCPHCQEETPVYNQIYDTYVATNKDVVMMGINATPRGHDNVSPATVEDLKWFTTTWSAKYPLFFDKALASAQAYGINSYPSVYIIDKQGTVAFEPPTDALPTYAQLSTKIDELLAK